MNETPLPHAVSVVLRCGDQFILQHRDDREGVEAPGKVHFFGGGLEDSDVSPEAGARRELSEETSLDVDSLTLRKVWEGERINEADIQRKRCYVTLYETELSPEQLGFDVFEGQGKVIINREDLEEIPNITPFARKVIELDNYKDAV